MDGQQRMMLGAPAAISVSAHYELGDGWVLNVTVRRDNEVWEEARIDRYTHLTTDELEQVLADVLGAALSARRSPG